MFGLSALWHKVRRGSFYEKHYETTAVNVDRIYVLIGYFVIGLLLALIYPIGYNCEYPMKEGPRFGAIMGLLGLFPATIIVF